MAENEYSRRLNFESLLNFRDMGGYRTRSGYSLVWRRLFRSGEFREVNENDLKILKEEIGLKSIIDLRSQLEVEKQGHGLLAGSTTKYHNICLIPDGGDQEANERRYKNFTNMGQFYLDLMHQKGFGEHIIEALELIASAENHPLVFHCAVGKDRTGIIAAVLLNLLGVEDEDIILDYTLSAEPMKIIKERFKNRPEKPPGNTEDLPDYFWDAAPESMALLLSRLKSEYGTILEYLKERGADASLVKRLEKALLR